MQKQSLWTQAFMGMSLSSFFQYMTHYALIAVMPVFVIEQMNGNDWQAGLAMTFFQIGAVLCRPLAGKWIDEYDSRKMLFLSLGVFLLVSIMYLGAADSLYFLLIIRLLHGAVFAIGTTLVATMAALALPATRRGEGIGYFAMFSNLAMVVGPFWGLIIIAHYQFIILFAGCIVLAILAFWSGNRAGVHSVAGQETTKKSRRALEWSNFIEPCALPMALTGGLLFFAYTGVLVFIPLYAKQLNLTEYTSAFFAVFALFIVATRPLVGRVFDRSGANTVVYPGFIFFMLGLLGLTQVEGPVSFFLAGSVIGIGFGALSPVFQTLAIQLSPAHRAGVATATYFLALDISVGLGSFFLSVVTAHAGYHAMYFFAAAVTGITAVVYYVLSAKCYTAKLAEAGD
ncbi:MFS transporter [Sporomusa aerivorans]|uniref:MFS transporter n=1 Tax=Sporomusa aerivorans TaxID=204936 RepID=UPI00352B0EDA